MYDNLCMPWDLEIPILAFPRSGHVRYEWNRNGKLECGKENFFAGSEQTIRQLSSSLGTASMVTRWREAHPAIAETKDDCVALTMKRVAQELGFADELEARDAKITVGSAFVLLMYKCVPYA